MPKKHEHRIIQLGLNIAFYRKMKGLNQDELASIVGVSRTHISKIEAPNIISSPSLELIFDIADALNVEPSKLFELR